MRLPKKGKGISVSDVKKMREKKPAGGGLLNEKQLLETDFDNWILSKKSLDYLP